MGQAGVICRNCGTVNSPQDQFCSNCGYELTSSTVGSNPRLSTSAPAIVNSSGHRSTGALAIGSLLSGRYHIVQLMGKGGFGAVYKALDGIDNLSQLKLDQLVNQISASGENAGNAVKVFTIAYGSDANGLTKIASVTGGQEDMGQAGVISKYTFRSASSSRKAFHKGTHMPDNQKPIILDFVATHADIVRYLFV